MGYKAVKTVIGDVEETSILATVVSVPYEFVFEHSNGFDEENRKKFSEEHKRKMLEAIHKAITEIEGIYKIEWEAGNLSQKVISEDPLVIRHKNYVIIHRYVDKSELEG